MATAIDWRRAQARLGVKSDGQAGPVTYAALFRRLAAPAAPLPTLAALGAAAAVRFPSYGVDASVHRLADLLAQGAHETGGFVRWEENLRYTAARLCAIWPKRFPTLAIAKPFAWDPSDPDREDIALGNRVYGDRMGNQANGLADDDGWNSRGMGLLMLTGVANRRAADRRLGLGLDRFPDLAADPATSLWIACDFYRANAMLDAIDAGDLAGARRIVNCGDRASTIAPLGWSDVEARRRAVIAIVG